MSDYYEYIRTRYGVPAERGREIEFEGERLVITGYSGPHLLAAPKHGTGSGNAATAITLHPTLHIDWLDGKGQR